MMYPILCKVRYEKLHHLLRTGLLWRQIVYSVILNWIVAPLVMVCLFQTGRTLARILGIRMLIWARSDWHGHFFRTNQHFEKV